MYRIHNKDILKTIDFIEEVTGCMFMDTVQKAIEDQICNESEWVHVLLAAGVDIGVSHLSIPKWCIQWAEPIDIDGWIPVSRADELVGKIDDYQAVIVAESVEAILSSDTEALHVGTWVGGEVVASPKCTNELGHALFKVIRL